MLMYFPYHVVKAQPQQLFLIFSVCAPQYVMRPSSPSTLCTPLLFTEHVSLHSESLCRSIWQVRLGGANNIHTLSLGGTNGKDPILYRPNSVSECRPSIETKKINDTLSM